MQSLISSVEATRKQRVRKQRERKAEADHQKLQERAAYFRDYNFGNSNEAPFECTNLSTTSQFDEFFKKSCRNYKQFAQIFYTEKSLEFDEAYALPKEATLESIREIMRASKEFSQTNKLDSNREIFIINGVQDSNTIPKGYSMEIKSISQGNYFLVCDTFNNVLQHSSFLSSLKSGVQFKEIYPTLDRKLIKSYLKTAFQMSNGYIFIGAIDNDYQILKETSLETFEGHIRMVNPVSRPDWEYIGTTTLLKSEEFLNISMELLMSQQIRCNKYHWKGSYVGNWYLKHAYDEYTAYFPYIANIYGGVYGYSDSFNQRIYVSYSDKWYNSNGEISSLKTGYFKSLMRPKAYAKKQTLISILKAAHTCENMLSRTLVQMDPEAVADDLKWFMEIAGYKEEPSTCVPKRNLLKDVLGRFNVKIDSEIPYCSNMGEIRCAANITHFSTILGKKIC